ncbi:DEAD/DEAH box helicase [Pseudomonas aeruginosa]|nr:DEAD/DEAH box helicase [Pseudomonas aeruginosa]
MSELPESVRFLDSAASSAAKARGVEPTFPTEDPVDVATALKCINAFQIRVDEETLEALDDESKARPLVAAARILQSTAQHLRQAKKRPVDDDFDDLLGDENLSIDEDLNDLSFYAALAFAMHGNFPSARAVLADVDPSYIRKSQVFRMVAAICEPSSYDVRYESDEINGSNKAEFKRFRRFWKRTFYHSSVSARAEAFASALRIFSQVSMAGTLAEGALLLGGRMAAYQAKRLATINLLDAASEIPYGFVRNTIKSGMVTLLPPQHILLSKERIAKHRRNTLLTLPTSTGKTFIAEACIAADLADNGLCVYVAPYVAVGEQVRSSLENRLREIFPVIPMFGGFQSEAVSSFAEGEVIVATPERFDGWLRAGEDIDRLRTVIFDEIHILENGARGARVEGLISRIRLLQRTNSKLRIIGLSAVLTEPEAVCAWLGVTAQDLHQIGWRPTARRLAMCRANGDMYWIHGTDTLRPAEERPTSEISEPIRINLPGKITPAQFPKPNEKSAAANVGAIARDLLSRLGSPGLIVCPRKVDTRLLARELLAGREEVEDDEVAGIAASILERYPYLDFLVECLKRGVSYHNASLPFDVRRDIEKLTRERVLSVVCATTTLAEGADLPFRWTIVAHWLTSMRDTGTDMKSMIFRNIAGRCGRAGAFSEGDTILFENLMGPPSLQNRRNIKQRLEEVMFVSSPLASTMGGNWRENPPEGKSFLEATISAQLLACIAEHPNSEDIVSELTNASYAGQTDGKQNVKRILSETAQSILDDQQPGGAMAVVNSPIRLTDFGRAANLSGFSPGTCRLMMEFLSEQSFEVGAGLYSEILRRFSSVPEQSNTTLQMIFERDNHRNVVKASNIEEVLEGLLLRKSLRLIFEGLRKKTSKAMPETVETMFEDFVSFVNGVIANFLPWTLRGLGKLSAHGSKSAANINWSQQAKDLEFALRARVDNVEFDDPSIPVE